MTKHPWRMRLDHSDAVGGLVETWRYSSLRYSPLGYSSLVLRHCFAIGYLMAASLCSVSSSTGAETSLHTEYPAAIRSVLEGTRPLTKARGNRMPLLLWPVHAGVVSDQATQEAIIRELDARGIAMIATWHPENREKSLRDALTIARIQKKLGLPVYVNANSCMYAFYNGDASTAHLDDQDKPFFDPSITGEKIGCPFRIRHRYAELTEQVAFFVRGYQEADVPLDFVFGDWEIDGPLEVNRAWEAARRCQVCRKNIAEIDTFEAFQKAVRIERSRATRECYANPILSEYPQALVGNYGVYPHDGYRYWYDYFEEFADYQPHLTDQRAHYRQWFDDFPLTGYTFAMPVVYPWARGYLWYDFPSTDYRWIYNMLRVASNAGAHTPDGIPIVPFVHFEPIYEPDPGDDSIRPLTKTAYQELLWHMLLRGTDTFFLWCRGTRAQWEVPPLHEVWAESLEYSPWLENGYPVLFDVPGSQTPIVSAVRLGGRLLVRRTDFDESHPSAITIKIDGTPIDVPRMQGKMQVLEIGK